MKLFKISLTWQMVLATILGIICGLFFGELCSVFAPWGSAYIMILKITTIPYLFFAIIHGIGQLGTSQGLEILKKGLFFIAVAWIINITMIYAAVILFPVAHGGSTASYFGGAGSGTNFATLLIPENIFHALSNNVVPAIVVFSLILGISLMHVREKRPLMQIFESIVDALTRITAWISRITPFGTFLIIAHQVGTIQFSTIKQVSTYIILYILVICTVVFWVFPRLVNSLTNIPTFAWVRHLFPILVLGYTTNVVIVCLPFIIELIKKEVQKFLPTDDQIQSQIQGTVSVVFNLPLGSLFITIFIFFIAVFYGTPLDFSSQIQLFINSFLTSLGSVGLGAWINSLNFILERLGLPAEAINIYLTTLPFTSGFQAMISVMEIASLSLLIILACHRLLVIRIGRVLRKGLFTVMPLGFALILMNAYNPLPKIQNTTMSIFDVELYNSATVAVTSPLASDVTEDPFTRVLRTKTLRVGFNPNAGPFCFINAYGQTSGYDIVVAHQLAHDLGCKLILVPMDYDRITEQLNQGEFDIGMSAISITEERLRNLYFSKPYMETPIIFVTSQKQKRILSKPDAVILHPELKIGVLRGSSYESLAKTFFPQNSLILLEDCNNFVTSGADLMIWSEKQAISWLLHHPEYTIVHPDAPLGIDTLAYPISQKAELFLNYMNIWLDLKKNDGFAEAQYNLWILGKTEAAREIEPRWSILRNILNWKN